MRRPSVADGAEQVPSTSQLPSQLAIAFSRLRQYGWAMPALCAIGIVAAPLLGVQNYDQRQIVLVGVYTLIVSGLNVSFGYGGELAFGQVAMFAAGAYVTEALANHGIHDVMLALVLSILAAGLLGIVSGVPGLRLGEWPLALSSFFLVILVPYVVEALPGQTGGLPGISAAFSPTFAGASLAWTGFYVLSTAVAVAWLIVARNLMLSGFGKSLLVIRESPVLAASIGLSVQRRRLQAYFVGSLPAGVAGCLFAYLTGYISPSAFTLDVAIVVLAASIIGGADSIYGAPLGAALLVIGPLQVGSFQKYSTLVYGAFLLIVGTLFASGLSGLGRRGVAYAERRSAASRAARLSGMPARSSGPDRMAAIDGTLAEATIPGQLLVARGVTKSFGGVRALAGVDLVARPGAITAIIGSNGAGKTTLLNVISGFHQPDEGSITVGTHAVGRLPADRIARLGMRRTFQTPLIPRDMTAAEVVETGRLGLHSAQPLASILRLPSYRRSRQADASAAISALSFAGQSAIADADARSLPLGGRRLLEVVRAIAAEPAVVLMDEPAAGLDGAGLAELGALMRRARDAGATVVLVEHNLGFVMGLADYVYVMELGTVIASGEPDEVRRNPLVIASYLGRQGIATVQQEGASDVRPAERH